MNECDPGDIVPRRMLELCRDTLRQCLGEGIGLQNRIVELEQEIEWLREHRDGDGP